MVVTSIFGGLGNQLFQYAVGRAVALRYGTTLKLDVTAYEVYKLQAYGLHHFNIREELAYSGTVARLFGQPANRHLRKLRRYLPYFWLRSVKEQRQFQFDPDIFSKGRHVLLYGFWQSEGYFRDISDLLRQELTVKTAADSENVAMAEAIQSVAAVSVHVRRADYVTDPQTALKHGACSVDYYRSAIGVATAEVRNPHFFVFSDDSGWAQANLVFDRPVTHVTHNKADRNYEDLRLMTLCRHHIIANSTFSWWGGWLGTNPQRMVIAPKRWLNDDTIDTGGLFPPTWRRM
jgi:hypothetical protein